MEDTRAKDHNYSREEAITEAVKELSESLIATNEAMGRLLYMLSYGKWKMPESVVKPEGVEHNAEQPQNQVSSDYEAVRSVAVREAASAILEKSAFEIPRDAIEFRKFGPVEGGDTGIEFRVVHYSDGTGVVRRSSESFVVCAEGGVYDVDDLVAQFDRNIEALSIVRFHRKSRQGHGAWDSL